MTMVLLTHWVRILAVVLLMMSRIEEARHVDDRCDIVGDEASAVRVLLMAMS